MPGVERVYERDRPFRIHHIALDLTLDVPEKRVAGTARLRVTPVTPSVRRLELDAVAFHIRNIRVDGQPAKYDYDDTTLSIDVGSRARPSAGSDSPAAPAFEVEVEYDVTPRRGLYFLEPDKHVTARPVQVWTQGQDEDARCWFPCHDEPHEKQTTELRVRVPRGWSALSNGSLISRVEDDHSTVFHYRHDRPHSSYLVTLVAGMFAVIHDAPQEDRGTEPNTTGATKPIALSYWVPQGREDDAHRTFGHTREMVTLFERKTGIPYPWPSGYAQAVVSDFLFGGMENTSATSLYEHALLDERAAIDVDMDSLVAHELAHQWFGDFVTCRTWSEGWLNEGWATFMELVWKEEGRPGSPGFGRDEYDYGIKGEIDTYLGEARTRYRRPLVCRDYHAPIDIFDRHLYQKGAVVLHTIRRALGDETFWRGVHQYLERHAYGVVESRDFQRALEGVSGRSLDRVFDQFVHGAGHPEFEATVRYEPRGEAGSSEQDAGNPAACNVEVELTEQQPAGDQARPYRGDLTIEIAVGDRIERHVVAIQSRHHVFVFSTAAKPTWVAVDPEGDHLATFKLKVPPDLLRAQLRKGRTARIRWCAAAPLGKRDDLASSDALADALDDDQEFWGVRVEAAEALGHLRSPRAFERLRAATAIAHPKVRRAVARALAGFQQPEAVAALQPLALSDPSYLVSSEAARSLGGTRQGEAFDTLVEVLDRRAWADVARVGAADGLAALRDERAVAHLTTRTAYGNPGPGRRACLVALAKLDPSRKTRELIEDRLDDRDQFVRLTAIRALEIVGDPKARTALAERLEREDAATVRRRLREALRDITTDGHQEVRRLHDELERQREELHGLRMRLARLEADRAPSSEVTSPPTVTETKSQKSAKTTRPESEPPGKRSDRDRSSSKRSDKKKSKHR